MLYRTFLYFAAKTKMTFKFGFIVTDCSMHAGATPLIADRLGLAKFEVAWVDHVPQARRRDARDSERRSDYSGGM